MNLACPTCASTDPEICLLGGGPHSWSEPNEDFACCSDAFHDEAREVAA